MITAEEEEALRAEAKRLGRDPDKFVEAARKRDELKAGPSTGTRSNDAAPSASASEPEKPKLFQYHLPFVTVAEVRRNWLGLTEDFEGDDEIAADWAREHPLTGGAPDLTGGGEPPPTE